MEKKINDLESDIPLVALGQRATALGLRVEASVELGIKRWNIYRIIDNQFLSTMSGDISFVSCFLAGWHHCKEYYEKEPPSDWFLRVCVEARDKEWWKAICNLEEVKANPQAIKEWLTNALGVDIDDTWKQI